MDDWYKVTLKDFSENHGDGLLQVYDRYVYYFFVIYFVDLAYAVLCWSHLFFFLIFNLGLFSPFLFIFVLKERGPHHRSGDV